jgi:hypothetical protein
MSCMIPATEAIVYSLSIAIVRKEGFLTMSCMILVTEGNCKFAVDYNYKRERGFSL